MHATGHTGGVIAMRVGIVIKPGASGLISRIDEYFDPAQIAPLVESPKHSVGSRQISEEMTWQA